MRPSRGEIKWFDEEKTPRGKIGYIPELPVLPARIKVAELLESLLGLNAEKIDQMEAINSHTHSLSISNLLNRPAHLLSKGQQQRLLLTLALSGQPKGFVLDEPFSGLDPWARTELADLLISLAEQKKFLLISSHDAPQRLRVHVRETWVIENEQLKIHTGCALPE
jgi:ABC-2 type transport system ATP-binding protein